MHEVRAFQLHLCVNVWGPVREYTVRALEEAVAVERANGFLNGFLFTPLVTYNPHWDLWCGLAP